jgi:hypothetical protein
MIIAVLPAAPDEIVKFVGLAVRGGLTVDDLMFGEMFKVLCDGEIVAGYTLGIDQNETKRVAWIIAFGGRLDSADLLASVYPIVQRQAAERGADEIGILTARRGLVKKLTGLGFMQTAVEMRVPIDIEIGKEARFEP